MYTGDNEYEGDHHSEILEEEKNDKWHDDVAIAIVERMYAYDKDRLYGGDEELSSDLLEDIPFDAVAFSIMKADGKFGTDEEQRNLHGHCEVADEEVKPFGIGCIGP